MSYDNEWSKEFDPSSGRLRSKRGPMTMERLEKEVTRLQERNEMNVVEVRKAMHDVLRIAEVGCSDGGCGVLGRRSGQHTNGGCSCARKIGRRLEGVWRRLKREGIQPNASMRVEK